MLASVVQAIYFEQVTSFLKFLKKFLIFKIMVDLQYSINFCCTAKSKIVCTFLYICIHFYISISAEQQRHTYIYILRSDYLQTPASSEAGQPGEPIRHILFQE